MYTLGEGGDKLNICGLDHSGSETFNYGSISGWLPPTVELETARYRSPRIPVSERMSKLCTWQEQSD